MQIVTDGGMDLCAEQMVGLDIHQVPLTFTIDGRSYRSGVDIDSEGFYRLLETTDSFPTTSQPSAGEFAATYRRLAAQDHEILSIHLSSGLSSTLQSAQAGAALTPEAHVTFFDSKTLSGAQGWQVQAAARAAQANWPMDRILSLLERIRAATDTIYTLATLKYLIQGGRISHIKGLLAQVLALKPLISVEKVGGTYVQQGQARTMDRAILKLADFVAEHHAPGSALRVQVMHGDNARGAALLLERVRTLFYCTCLPVGYIAPVLGAHTGPGLVGIAFAPEATFADMP
jgi:DegV family protein with EDD domain